MELDKAYSPKDIESKWYNMWESSGYFKPTFKENSKNYCIQLPPPNITGTLHMGHGFQHTIMDILIRYHRMLGFNTLWQPGTDHAGIATQIVVERQLEAIGVSKNQLNREDFIKKVWEWKEISGDIITKQMRRLGASCDWSRERFTMDDDLSKAVIEVFVSLYEKGYIYRGKRLVNWDIRRQTAVSDLEVISVEEEGKLWHISYPIKESNLTIVIATTRPETMLGDVAVAVNPNDERYKDLIGKYAILPLVNREIPIIADDYVEISFGTGCLKITPAHDFNDYEIGKRHNLEMINIFTLDGYINENAPKKYQGLDKNTARLQVIADLEVKGLLLETKPHKLMVPRGEKDDVIIEPMLTDQWFMKMQEFADIGLDLIKKNEIQFVPDNWRTTYNNWLENIKDWCISRQLWWGHRIPAYYDEFNNVYVARSLNDAIKQAKTEKLIQDNDVLDTWFSSALWCFTTLGWPNKTKELEMFLPSNVLVTGFDIIFFWVARMIMLTQEFTEKTPFKEVLITGLIQDAHGNKMSKSKGNIIDPLDLVDGISVDELIIKRTANLLQPKQKESIAKQTRKDYPNGFLAFGADALRFSFASMATHGREIRFDIKRIEGSRNFCNKLWNASRFVLMNLNNNKQFINTSYNDLNFIDKWILTLINKLISEIDFSYTTYRFDILAQKLYEFVWNEYCDWYLEFAKVNINSESNKISTINTLLKTLDSILKLLHPIIPFITEEIWQKFSCLKNDSLNNYESIMISNYPAKEDFAENNESIEKVNFLKEIVVSIRNLRAQMNISPAEKVSILIEVKENFKHLINEFIPYIFILAKASEVNTIDKFTEENTFAPIAVIGSNIRVMLKLKLDINTEKLRIAKEIEKINKEIEKIKIKSDNPNFIARAPKDLVERDKRRINELNEVLAQLNKQMLLLK